MNDEPEASRPTDAPSDLSRFERPAPAPRRSRRIGPRVAVGLILIGFVALLGERAFDALSPRTIVTIVRPIASGGDAARGTVALQVASFLEADPYPVVVTPFVQGVFAKILVESGDVVREGTVLATLDDAEASLALRESESDSVARSVEVVAAEERRALAQDALDRAIALEGAVTEARAELAGQEQNAALREAAVSGAIAQTAVALAEYEREVELAKTGTTGSKQVEVQAARLASARASESAARAEAALASALRDKAAAAVQRASAELVARTALKDRLAESRGVAESARAVAAGASARAERDRLRLARTRLVSPIDGVVQSVHVRPGDPANPEHGAIVLFAREHLRARVDIPLGSISRVKVGQKARIRPEGSDRVHLGEVSRISAEADIQKITLRAHVRILEGGEDLVPERLCQVEILADEGTRATGGSRSVTIPRAALRMNGSVLVLDPSGERAESRAIVSIGGDGDRVEVTSGLDLSDKVILTPSVVPGDRVRVEGSP